MIIATTPPRITITADAVRELLRQWPEWSMAPNASDFDRDDYGASLT